MSGKVTSKMQEKESADRADVKLKAAEQRRIRDLERVLRLKPFDDEFARCLLQDRQLAQEILRILTNKQDLVITDHQTQRDMIRLNGAKSIVLDVWATDSEGTIYNIEIQRVEEKDLPRRVRYYASALDIDSLNSGQKFNELPECWVIFIMEHDPFGAGEPLYHLELMVGETGEQYPTGRHVVLVNGDYEGDDPVGRLMHDMKCTQSSEMHMDSMRRVVKNLKENEEGELRMSWFSEELREEGREEGRAQGREEGRAEGRAEGEIAADLKRLSALMETTKWSVEKAMNVLKIAEDQKPRYRELLKTQAVFED